MDGPARVDRGAMNKVNNYAALSCSAILGLGHCSAQTLPAENDGVRDEVRAIVAEMLSDAQSRSSLLALNKATAGHENGFFIGSADGNFRMRIDGVLRMRYIANLRSDDGVRGVPGGATDPGGSPRTGVNSGFEVRKVVVRFAGHAISPDLRYTLSFSSENPAGNGGSPQLEDAAMNYRIPQGFAGVGEGWNIRFGQFKFPFMRESLIDDSVQVAVERSLVEQIFGAGRSQGVEIGHTTPGSRVLLGLHDGFSSSNTSWTSESVRPGTRLAPRGERALGLSARGEWILQGKRENLTDLGAPPGQDLAAQVGVAASWNQSRRIQDSVDGGNWRDFDAFGSTVDVQIDGGGLGLFGAVVSQWNRAERNNAGAGSGRGVEAWNLGFVALGTVRPRNELELFVRYEALMIGSQQGAFASTDPDREIRSRSYNFVTTGATWLFAGRAVQLTVDTVLSLNRTARLFDGAPAPTGSYTDLVELGVLPSTNVGLLGSAKGLEAVVRAQFQLLF